nr:MAG TPA: hypothetical protein [Caudoviricetes sp.]
MPFPLYRAGFCKSAERWRKDGGVANFPPT